VAATVPVVHLAGVRRVASPSGSPAWLQFEEPASLRGGGLLRVRLDDDGREPPNRTTRTRVSTIGWFGRVVLIRSVVNAASPSTGQSSPSP
jgi:hypothetical protein